MPGGHSDLLVLAPKIGSCRRARREELGECITNRGLKVAVTARFAHTLLVAVERLKTCQPGVDEHAAQVDRYIFVEVCDEDVSDLARLTGLGLKRGRTRG